MGKGKRRDHKRRGGTQSRQLELFESPDTDSEGGAEAVAAGQEQPQEAHAVDFEGANEYGLPAQKPPSVASESAPVADAGNGREANGMPSLPGSVPVPDIGEHDAIQDPSVEEFCEQVARIVARGKPGQVRRKQ